MKMAEHARPMSRRAFLGLAGGAAATMAVVSGCGFARPASAHAKIALTFQAVGIPAAAGGNSLTSSELAQRGLEPFLAANPGVEVTITATEFASNVPAIIGGGGDDIIHDNYCPPYWESNLLLPLDGYLKQDGIDTSIWSQGQLQSFQSPQGLFMLGAYFSPFIYIVNMSLFDNLGLPYPSTDWTATEFVSVCQSLYQGPGATGGGRYGATLQWSPNEIGPNTYILKAFGGALTDSTGTVSYLNKQGSIAAGQWLYEELLWPGLAITRNYANAAQGMQDLVSGSVGMLEVWGGAALNAAEILQGLKWGFWPFPIFPAGRTTMGTSDFYGININTRHPDAAWSLLKWATAEPAWQRFATQTTGTPPTLVSLWEEWAATMEQVAPSLKGTGMSWWVDAAVKGYALPEVYYRYDDQAAQSIVDPYIKALTSHTTTASLAFTDAASAVTAFEQQAGVAGGIGAKEEGMAQGVKPGSSYPAPPTTGAGTPSTAAPSGAIATQGTGLVLTGAGTGLSAEADQGVFAATAETAYQGTWTVELTSLTNNGSVPWMGEGVQVGILARSDLSSDAMMYGVVVTGAGVATVLRGRIGLAVVETTAVAVQPQGRTGYIAPQFLLRNFDLPATNYLLQPVWLRLARDGTNWSAQTSLDGQHWASLGAPVPIPMGGVWVGPFLASGGTGGVQATLGSVSEAPTTPVLLGSAAGTA